MTAYVSMSASDHSFKNIARTCLLATNSRALRGHNFVFFCQRRTSTLGNFHARNRWYFACAHASPGGRWLGVCADGSSDHGPRAICDAHLDYHFSHLDTLHRSASVILSRLCI